MNVSRGLAYALYVAAAVCAYVLAADPTSLGLPEIARGWLGVLGFAITTAMGFLPAVHR